MNDDFIKELEQQMGVNGVINTKKPDVKFEKAYVTMVCNPNFNNNEVRLWLYLQLNNSERNGGAFPSAKKITEDTGMSASTVSRTLKELESKHALFTVQRFRKSDRKQLQNLVIFNTFDEHKGTFSNSEVWQYFNKKYETRMCYVEVKKNKHDNKDCYLIEPIAEEELTVNAKGVKMLKPREGEN